MAPAFIYETLECLGGNGYVEDFPIARLYREAPLNAIWEGSGNVMASVCCARCARATRKPPSSSATWRARPRRWSGRKRVPSSWRTNSPARRPARVTVGKLATLAAAAALEATAPPAVAEAFVRTRLLQQHAALYGADGIEAQTAETLLQRALPE